MTTGWRLAAFVAGLQWEAVPAPLREKVLSHVLDTLGVMCAGVGSAEGNACEQAVLGWGTDERCTVVGRTRRLPPTGAAFVNAFHARLRTFDDVHEVGPLHPGCAAVSAALACGESANVSGRTFLAAVLAGYEAGLRVSAAVSPAHYGRGFQNTGTCNVFTAAAAAARIMEFEPEAVLECFGLAGESAAGLRQFHVDGSMVDSSFAGARAAMLGVMTAQMRAAGLRGPKGIIEGKWGFCRVLCDAPDLSRIDSGLGETFAFAGTALKPYPSCRFTHGPVDALLQLRHDYGIVAEDVDEVVISAFRESVQVSDRPRPASAMEAILSHQYAAALALMFGRVDLAAYGDSVPQDAMLPELMRRVSVAYDAELEREFPRHWPHRVTIRLRDGRALSARSDDPPGGIGRPLRRAEVERKFHDLADPVLGCEAAAQVAAAVYEIPDAPSLDRLTRSLGGAASASQAARVA